MADRTLKYRVLQDTSDFHRGTRAVDRDLAHLESRGQRFARRFGPAIATAGTAALGGLILGGKAAASAAIEAEKSQARLEAQLKSMGTSYAEHGKQIDAVIQKHSQLSGLDDEDLADSFTNIVRVTGDVNKALELNGLAADIARAKHMDVAKAGELVGKVAGGNTGILSRYGIQIEKGATASEALAKMQELFAGQAEAYGKTTGGSLDRMNVAAENLAETVGTALAPTVADVADKVATFINEMQSGEGAGGRFVRKLEDIRDAIRPIVNFFKDHPALIAVAVGAWGTYKAAMIATSVAQKFKAFRNIFGGASKIAAAEGVVAGRAYATGAASSGGMGTLPDKVGRSGLKGKLVTLFRGIGLAAGIGFGAEIASEINKAVTRATGSDANDYDRNPQTGSSFQIPGAQWLQQGAKDLGEGALKLGKFLISGSPLRAHRMSSQAMARELGGPVARAGVLASASRIPTRGADNTYGSGGNQGGWKPCELTYYQPSKGGINADSTPGTYADGSAVDEQHDWVCAAPGSFPFGTIIEFKYGGRGVRVVVRDRGGAIQGNRFDLIYNAARELGILSVGRAQASYRVVGRAKNVRSTGTQTMARTMGAALRANRGPSYPLGKRGQVIGTPHAGTHTLGNWQSDNAVDIRVEVGTPVLAVRDGVVTKVAIKPNDGGRFAGSQVTLQTAEGGVFYTHLASVSVSQGQRVRKGEMIGRSGSANGVPHLHIGTEKGDPRRLLEKSHIGGGSGAIGSVALDPRWEPTTRFERAMARNDIRTARAGATRGVEDDIAAARGRRRLLARRIKGIQQKLKGKGIGPTRRLQLQGELASLIGERAGLTGTIRDLRTPQVSLWELQQAQLDSNIAVAEPGSRQELTAQGSKAIMLGMRLRSVNRRLAQGGLSRRRRQALLQERADLAGELRTSGERITELRTPPDPTLLNPEREQALAAIDAAEALAALDPAVNAADTFAADERVRFWQDRLAAAQQMGNNSFIAEAASQLKSSIDSRNSLEEAIRGNTDSNNALADSQKVLADEMKAVREQAAQIGNQSYGVIAKGLVDFISGQIGGRTGVNFAAAGVPGSVARF